MNRLVTLDRFPRMLRVRQNYPPSASLDVAAEVALALDRSGVLTALAAGDSVAVAVGSRGITDLAVIVAALVRRLQGAGLCPFIVPAMGSHGGATPEGQAQLLADYGITPAAIGIPIAAAMEAELIGTTADGAQVFCAAAARRASAILLVNRVKPHTDFGGAIGSGLLKMAVVGLGKHAGAVAFHRAAQRLGHEHTLRTMARIVLQETPVLGGLAIVEDPRHQTARVEVLRASRMEAEESRLAAEAARLMPRLPLDEIDLLIVDRMGKNLSGTGMDPNVIGRLIHGYSLLGSEMPRHPRIRRIFVRDLTPESHGNATGIGMADFATSRLVRAMDPQATYTNALTALSLQGSKIPIHLETDRECVAAALNSLGLSHPEEALVIRIRDTLSLAELEASESCAAELASRAELEFDRSAREMRFDERGSLLPLMPAVDPDPPG